MEIVIADDDEQVRSSVRRLIEGAGLRVVGEAANGGEALALTQALAPQIVVMDGKMPVINGVVATQYLLSLYPHIKVIAHSSDPVMSAAMIDRGAVASVAKGSAGELLSALQSATSSRTSGVTTGSGDE